MLKKKISKKILKRVIKRPNPSNLKWKLDDYIRTWKLRDIIDEDKKLLSDIQKEINQYDLTKEQDKIDLYEFLRFNQFHYASLMRIIERDQNKG